ncbi:elongation factor G [Novosphingobium sp. G106]|uniref:elongation factor G n=1 Tax=Novosphingobium sp. G106 TaxID=2849500 RepID=UPI001C2D132B|nr:elongation factor G [Novosphingobium sp. G106]MBV1691782.1 elongation factor G [Novosphingobium sp. G106]
MGNVTHKGSANGSSSARAPLTRAIALVGPAGTGKTSLAEALLFASGAINRQGSVEAGTTVGDASPEARARRGSTEINLMHLDYLGDHFALIDMPGGTGFAADGLAALQSADMALVVIDPAPERAALAEPMLRRLDELGVPHAIFVNKIENARAGAIRDLIAELQPMSGEPLALRQIPIREGEHVTGYVDLAMERAYRYRPGKESERVEIPGELLEREREERGHLLETLADFDDALLETLLMDETPDPSLVMADLAIDTATGKVVPVLLGSALTGGGVHRLLKLLRHEVPEPEIAAIRLGVENGTALHVFKIANGGAMGRLALGRVLGAGIHEGDELIVGDESARTGSLFVLQGDKTAKQAAAASGDVVAVAKVDAARSGMLLPGKGAKCTSALLVEYPARNASLAITTRDRKDDVKLSTALHRLCEEDPALQWSQDDATHETLLRGVNDDHLAVVLGRLQRRYGVSVDTRPPRIAYRESIRKGATQRGRHKKQSGGHGQYGDCVIEIRPLGRGEGFQFTDKISGGAIPKQYIPAVEAGIRDAMEKGPLGFPVVDVAVTLTDGSFHTVDSSELAFRIAGRMAMSEALASAAPYLLEPICKVAVDTPSGTGSKAGSVLSSRRGQILGLSPHPDWARWERVEALLPEAALHGLDAELRSLSQGLAGFTAGFDHLQELGGKHADDVVKARTAEAA